MLFEIKGIAKRGEYRYAIVPDHPNRNKHNYVLMHRVVMENHLDRLLLPNEIVHHKDGNKANNDISNLEVMTNEEHSHMHNPKRGETTTTLICDECGKSFQRLLKYVKISKNKHFFCCRECLYSFERKYLLGGRRKKSK